VDGGERLGDVAFRFFAREDGLVVLRVAEAWQKAGEVRRQ
jgi:hypothetical protein